MHALKKNFTLYSGQTFLEVIIALALIVLFLSGVAVVELYAIRNVEYSQSKSLASKLARQQLERARVVRDSAGIDALTICLSSCYINSALTPVPLTPTGVFGQSIIMENATQADCPVPTASAGQPNPVYYKAKSVVSWSRQAGVTPAPGVEMSTCITDWR